MKKSILGSCTELGFTTNKKYRFQPDVIKRYQARIAILENADKIEDLYSLNSLHYKILKGDKKDISSIRVNNQ